MQYVLCRTFLGNSKSNGNIKNNFSVFERYVGTIHVNGGNAGEIARSIAENMVEVFTQLRNHSPRGRLRGSTPAEATTGAQRPEDKRNAIEKMAGRFDRENRNCDEKRQLIGPARERFGPLLPESETKIKRILGKYPAADIISAQASYLAQIAKYPESRYGPEYFLSILRHKRKTIAKQTYNEAFRAGAKQQEIILPTNLKSVEDYAAVIIDELLDIMSEPTPALKMLRLEAVAPRNPNPFKPESISIYAMGFIRLVRCNQPSWSRGGFSYKKQAIVNGSIRRHLFNVFRHLCRHGHYDFSECPTFEK